MQRLSPLRARLASYEHAYAIAVRLQHETGRDHFIIRTFNPLQPVRVTAEPPSELHDLMAWII